MTPRIVTGLGVLSSLGVHDGAAFFEAAKNVASTPGASKPESFDAAKYEGGRWRNGEGQLPLVEVLGFDPKKHLGDKGLRTLDRLTKLLVVASRICLHDAGFKKENAWAPAPGGFGDGSPTRIGVCCSNAYGSLEAIHELDSVAKLEDARYINPAKFPNTVSNSAAGYISIWEDLRALNVSVSDGVCGGLDAIAMADLLMSSGRADAIVTGGGESMSEALFLAFMKLELLGAQRLGEGAAFFALESDASARARGAKRHGAITGYGTAFVGPENPDAELLCLSKTALARACAAALADAGLDRVDLVVTAGTGLDAEDAVVRDVRRELGLSAPLADGCRRFGETLGASGSLGIAAALAALNGSQAGPMLEGVAPTKPDTVLVTSLGHYGNASAVVVRR